MQFLSTLKMNGQSRNRDDDFDPEGARSDFGGIEPGQNLGGTESWRNLGGTALGRNGIQAEFWAELRRNGTQAAGLACGHDHDH